jgi:hypothetical protein
MTKMGWIKPTTMTELEQGPEIEASIGRMQLSPSRDSIGRSGRQTRGTQITGAVGADKSWTGPGQATVPQNDFPLMDVDKRDLSGPWKWRRQHGYNSYRGR